MRISDVKKVSFKVHPFLLARCDDMVEIFTKLNF